MVRMATHDRTIVAGIDGSEAAGDALALARSLAEPS
jgi:hypothetical protein